MTPGPFAVTRRMKIREIRAAMLLDRSLDLCRDIDEDVQADRGRLERIKVRSRSLLRGATETATRTSFFQHWNTRQSIEYRR
jgi:hypothetical protein